MLSLPPPSSFLSSLPPFLLPNLSHSFPPVLMLILTSCLHLEKCHLKQLKRHGVVTPRAAVSECHKLGSLKRQTRVPSQFGRTGVPNQGAGRTELSPKAPGEGPPWPLPASRELPAALGFPGLTDASLQSLPLFSHGISVRLCIQTSLSSQGRTPVLWGRYNTPRDEVCET